jgi:hypothetical protein
MPLLYHHISTYKEFYEDTVPARSHDVNYNNLVISLTHRW